MRNLNTVSIELEPRLNFFIGENGAGKTSVLEALVVLAKGRSFRSGQLAALIGPKEDQFRVVMQTTDRGGAEHSMGIERSRKDWSARRNREDVQQLSDLAVHLPLVIVEPNSHLLVSGAPDGRRRFLDWGVFHVEPSHLVNWRRYARALKQRNAALRQRKASVISSLDPVLAELGEEIHLARERQGKQLFTALGETLKTLSPGLPSVEFQYQSGWQGDSLRKALERATERDVERGSTGPGPHRADIAIDCEAGPAREILSRGEQKILAAALLLTQASIMAETGERPMLLLDDLASEFDREHLRAVMAFGAQLESQLWVTGTSLEPYHGLQESPGSVFHVEHGKISRKSNS